MNYQKHYGLLIERAKNRKIETYKERHHVVPRCLGGDNKKSNIVDLTPEEHYLAHLLLVKIHHGNYKLVHAAHMMTVSSATTIRTNKQYGWLRKKLSIAAKQRVGKLNGSFGKRWYHDPVSLKPGKFEKCPDGWKQGRTPNAKCIVCNEDTGTKIRKYCNTHRPKPLSPTERGYMPTEKHKENVRQYCLSRSREDHPQFGKRWINNGDENKMISRGDIETYLKTGWKKGKIK